MLAINYIIESSMGSSLLLYFVIIPVVFLFPFLVVPDDACANVKGVCSNCHTMHNSQNNAPVYADGPVGNLLRNDCVGCHSSDTAETKVTNGSTIIPIVFNTSNGTPPAVPLAGGNFYWVEFAGDNYGHNVLGISDADLTLSAAPGSTGCANSCHTSLAVDTPGNGCTGCHNSVKHHGTDPGDGNPETADSGWYRFLSAPANHGGMGGAPVAGIEDADWEYTAGANDHNVYYKGTGSDFEAPQSIGKFCAGCHAAFHSPGFAGVWEDNGGGTDPWLRHPTDYAIPSSGEYAAIVGTAYDPSVPVGKPVPLVAPEDLSVVKSGDVVMCLSCHRAHGSPYPHMLRWNSDTIRTGATGAAVGTGCFKCHSAKDGA